MNLGVHLERMRYKSLPFIVLILLGLGFVGYGASLPSHTHHVGIQGPVEADMVGEDATVANYSELSATKQQIVDEALTDDTTVETPVWHSDEDFVRYQDEYYRVDDRGISSGNNFIYFSLGSLAIFPGVFGLVLLGFYWLGCAIQRRQ